jgi:hypothetical protein
MSRDFTRWSIINDQTADEYLFPKDKGRGLNLGLKTAEGLGSAASEIPADFLIPESDWEPRWNEQVRTNSTLEHLIKRHGVQIKNQKRTNYCWIFGPTYAAEVVRALSGQSYLSLSPASGGAQIKNYRNSGGWGIEAIKWIAERGLVPSQFWPDTAIDRAHATAENRERAMGFRSTEWYGFPDRDVRYVVSAILRRLPVPVGYSWWGHEVCSIGLAFSGGSLARLRIANSWDVTWGEQGYGWVEGRRMTPDDAVSPIVMSVAS